MTPYANICVKTGSGNGWLPDGTKLLCEPFEVRAISQETLKIFILDVIINLILQPHASLHTSSQMGIEIYYISV